MNWEAITAICATVSLIGLFGLYLVNSVIRSAFEDLMKGIRSEFATKEHVETVRERVAGLEARFNDARQRMSHGD
jgi:hypothetical protein